jgi:hypothetical protein
MFDGSYPGHAGDGGNRAILTLHSKALEEPLMMEVGTGTATLLQPAALAFAPLAGRPLPVLELLQALQQCSGLALVPAEADLTAAGLAAKEAQLERDMCTDVALARWVGRRGACISLWLALGGKDAHLRVWRIDSACLQVLVGGDWMDQAAGQKQAALLL